MSHPRARRRIVTRSRAGMREGERTPQPNFPLVSAHFGRIQRRGEDSQLYPPLRISRENTPSCTPVRVSHRFGDASVIVVSYANFEAKRVYNVLDDFSSCSSYDRCVTDLQGEMFDKNCRCKGPLN